MSDMGGFKDMMEMAKVTSKGQITIPISIRRRLGINEGDKILFVNKHEGVLMLNPDTVQGDISEYTADAVPVETPVTPAPAKPAEKPAAVAAKQAPAKAPEQQAESAVPAAALADETPASEPYEPQKRKYVPPVADDSSQGAAKSAGGIDLSTILDDIRSIGSNI